jgi:BMFP domain-containing protein YqiC
LTRIHLRIEDTTAAANMPARAFYLQLLQANCNILFQDHAPIAVVTSANYRILVLSGTTGEMLLIWHGTSHGDFEKFVTLTEQRLAKHLEAGRYKVKPKDSDNEQNKRNAELVARIERQEKELLDGKKKNDELMAMIADLEQKKRNAELVARIERQEKALLDGKKKNDELMAMIADLEQKRKEDFETAFRGMNVELRALRREIAPAIEDLKKRKSQGDGMWEYVDGVERNLRSLAARFEELGARMMGDHEPATPETWSEVGDTSGW